MQYAIHEDFYPELKKKLTRIAKKCERCGNDFMWEYKGIEMREDKRGNFHKFILIDVEGTAKVDDWEFVAVLDINEKGNVIRRYNTSIDLPERFKNSDNVCEHCYTKRNRNSLYVVHNTITDEFKQVGGNCLALYTNGLTMEYVAAWIDGITELQKANGVFYGGGERYYRVEDVLHYAYVITKKMGYLKSCYDGLSTKSLVYIMLRNDAYVSRLCDRVELLNDELCKAGYGVVFSVENFMQDTTSPVANAINYYMNCKDDSEFVHNIKIILDEKYIPRKYVGFACYIPNGYMKHMEQEAERAKRTELKHIHFGEVGKRYKGLSVQSIKRVAAYETVYGLMNVYDIILDGDIVLTWKTSTHVDEVGTAVDFTVKAHGEYKGVKQTEVSRCKFHSI